MKRKFLGGMLVLAFLSAWAGDDSLAEALNNGADAKIVLRVLDQSGSPVPNACVKCGVWRSHANGGPVEVAMRTDGDGMCTVLAQNCTGKITWSVNKDGYYNSNGQWKLASTPGHDKLVSNGKWLPFGKKEEVVLNKQKAPFKLTVFPKRTLRMKIPVFEEWIGFDLERCDWLPPYGNGERKDVMLRFHSRTANRFFDFNYAMDVSFTNNPFAGAYKLVESGTSDFKTEFNANTNKTFLSQFSFGLESFKNSGLAEHYLKKGEYLVFRTRTSTDDANKLVSAHYGRIDGIWVSDDKFMIIGDGCFNATPNDTNIEDGRSLRSLMKNQQQ